MTRNELSSNIAGSFSGLDKQIVKDIVARTFEEISTALANGENVQLTGFGTFELRQRSERQGVNPRTKESITIPASKTVGFKPGKALKESVNG
jgi:DNA-binding protein HU-beta